ncbi:MAG TPA: CDP-alcohol phosphatidyltransferase family protein, partial [Allosphingosinicella sp.]
MIRPVRERRGIPLRAVVPNAITALALCSGLSGVRFAIAADWDKAVAAIAIAAVLDGMDGRIARMLKGQSRFGAELDSLSDVIAFGVSPAIIMHLWALQYFPR